jgi:hypothetical protein
VNREKIQADSVVGVAEGVIHAFLLATVFCTVLYIGQWFLILEWMTDPTPHFARTYGITILSGLFMHGMGVLGCIWRAHKKDSWSERRCLAYKWTISIGSVLTTSTPFFYTLVFGEQGS